MSAGEDTLDGLARRLASGGLSRRESMGLGVAALVSALGMTPVDAWASIAGRCGHHRVSCHGKCCARGEVCLPPRTKGGKRHCGCPHHKKRCGSKCVDLKDNPQHCGACGNACATSETCVSGTCQPATCPAGQTNCSGHCVNLQNSPQNCGACGHQCGTSEVCSDGACGSACSSGETDCSGACVDLQTDFNNCGACGHACGPGQVCNGGTCACPSGTTACGGACVNLMTDFNNCGACGTKCCNYFANSSCVNGTCQINSCSPDWVNCSGNAHDGCNCLGTNCSTAICETPVGC